MDRGNPDRWTYGLAVATVTVLFLSAPAFAGVTPATYYSEPSEAPAQEIALSHRRAAAAELDLDGERCRRRRGHRPRADEGTGVTHVYLRQRVNGLEIDGAEMGIHVDRPGGSCTAPGSFVPDVAGRVAGCPAFPASPDEAVRAAAPTGSALRPATPISPARERRRRRRPGRSSRAPSSPRRRSRSGCATSALPAPTA